MSLPTSMPRHISDILSDFPAFLARTAERGGPWAKLVMILQPLWLTPARYARLPSLASRRAHFTTVALAAGSVTGMVRFAMPQAWETIVKAVSWEPVLAPMLAYLLCMVVAIGLVIMLATTHRGGLLMARPLGRLCGLSRLTVPPFGYHLRLVSGVFVWTGVATCSLVGLMSPWETDFLKSLTAFERWPAPAVLAIASLIGMTLLLTSKTEALRTQEIYGTPRSALAYRSIAAAAGGLALTALHFWSRVELPL
ncbi:hypothetical protein D3C72_410630 [compost metagenome]